MLQHTRRRAIAARLLAPVLALTALVPAAFTAPAAAVTPGCTSGGTNFSDVSTASAWVSAGFANGTKFVDAQTSDPALRTAKEWMSGGWGYISPDYVDLMGNGVALTTGNFTSLPVVQYYNAGTEDASCSMYFRMRLAVPAQSPAGQLANVNYKVALGNADSGTVAWAELNGHDNFVQLEDGAGSVLWSTAIDGGTLGADSGNFWVDTATASDGHGYWVNWRIPTTEIQTYTPGVLNHTYAALGGTSSSSAAGTWNKDCTDGFPAVDPHGHSLDSCAPDLFLWQYIFDAPVLPTMTIANGVETGTVVEETQTAGSPIAPVRISLTSGTIDTFTVDCNPILPANLTVTPIEGESVTSSADVSISGTLAPNATIGHYHCVITAWSPTGSITTDYYLHVLPLRKSVLYVGNGATSGVPANESETVGASHAVASGTPVRAGYTFQGWDTGTVVYSASDTFTMPNADVTLTAKWSANAPVINVDHGPQDSTTVSAIEIHTVGQPITGIRVKPIGPGVIDTYTVTCSPALPANIVATPTPNSGETATSSAGVSISGTLSLTAPIGTYNCVITAHGPGGTSSVNYTLIVQPLPIVTYKLTVSTDGDGTATPGTNWYNDGTKAVAVAAPAAGWIFTGWTGACTGTATTCEVLMTMDKAITAHFVKAVTITTHTNGSGTVNSSQPTGSPLLPGTKVTLNAVPAAGWKFTGWSGSCSGADNPITVTLDVSKDCTANLAEEPKPVELVAKNDTYKTALNTTLKLPAGASILNNDGSTATSVQALTKTKHGTVTLAANGRLVYKPNKGFVGVDSFKYKAFDANGRSVIATVRIVVAPPVPKDIKTGR